MHTARSSSTLSTRADTQAALPDEKGPADRDGPCRDPFAEESVHHDGDSNAGDGQRPPFPVRALLGAQGGNAFIYLEDLTIEFSGDDMPFA